MVEHSTSSRKRDHLELFRKGEPEEFTGGTWLQHVHLIHQALPELSLEEIDLSASCLGHPLRAPLLITGMTGGTGEAREINRALARVAGDLGIGFGLGSLRAALENPELTETYRVRDVAPDVFLLGNLGGTQLSSIPPDDLRRLLDGLGANALCVHLNPVQELFQPEGDRDFSGVLDAIGKLVKCLGLPVMVKETGAGLSRETARLLASVGIRCVDVSGAGGTSWATMELKRQQLDHPESNEFRGWGIPTAAAVCDLAESGLEIVASGGIRSGLDVARVLALGADVAGLAAPVLRAFFQAGEEACRDRLLAMLRGLRQAMLLTGSGDVHKLLKTRPVLTGPLKNWVDQRGAG